MEIRFSRVLGNMKINLHPFITLGRSHIPPLYKWGLVRSYCKQARSFKSEGEIVFCNPLLEKSYISTIHGEHLRNIVNHPIG